MKINSVLERHLSIELHSIAPTVNGRSRRFLVPGPISSPAHATCTWFYAMRETNMCAKNCFQTHSHDQISSRAEWHEVLDAATKFRQMIGGLIDERASLPPPQYNLSKDYS